MLSVVCVFLCTDLKMHRKKGDENAPGGKGVKGFVINITPTVFNFDQSKQTGEQMSSLLFGHLKGNIERHSIS